MPRVLIVEDNDVFRQIFIEYLVERYPFYEYEEARDGNEASLKVAEFYPDIIFMDINLPDKSGLDLTKEIKKGHPGIKIIIVTNYDFPEFREKAVEIGADFFLSKSSITGGNISKLIDKIYGEN